MSLLTALTSHLLNASSISALVGARVYPEKMPSSTSAAPNTLPLVTYQLIDEPVITTHANNNIFKARVQIDAWGGSYKSAQTVADALFDTLQGYHGALGDQTVEVGGVFRRSRRDQSDEAVELFRVSQDFVFNYRSNDG